MLTRLAQQGQAPARVGHAVLPGRLLVVGISARHAVSRASSAAPGAPRALAPRLVAGRPGRRYRLSCKALHSAVPPARGLYDPANDKDACGVGFVGELSKQPSRRTVTDALKMLARMTHRGACGCEENTGASCGDEGLRDESCCCPGCAMRWVSRFASHPRRCTVLLPALPST